MMKWFTAFALVLGSTMAHADGGKYSVPANPKWKAECGSCHVAFPPQLLTGENWQRLMAGLDKHFDTNAMLDPNDHREILDFLLRYAGHGKINSAMSMRITDTAWFNREHHDIPGDTWVNPAVKKRSNCTACHINAERGDWSERGVKMPGKQPRVEGRGEPDERQGWGEDKEGERDRD